MDRKVCYWHNYFDTWSYLQHIGRSWEAVYNINHPTPSCQMLATPCGALHISSLNGCQIRSSKTGLPRIRGGAHSNTLTCGMPILMSARWDVLPSWQGNKRKERLQQFMSHGTGITAYLVNEPSVSNTSTNPSPNTSQSLAPPLAIRQHWCHIMCRQVHVFVQNLSVDFIL